MIFSGFIVYFIYKLSSINYVMYVHVIEFCIFENLKALDEV